MFWDRLKRNKLWLIMALVFTLAVMLSVKVTDNFLDKDGLAVLDRPINQLIVNLRTPFLNKVMFFITLTGSWQMVVFGSLLSVLLLIAAQKRRYTLALLLSNISALVFINISKVIFSRVRPPIENALITEHGFAFPSGHSYFAVVFYGLLAYFWIRHLHQKLAKIIIFILGSGFIILLGFSRIYLGVHWTTDVVAGLSMSLAWLTVIITYIEYKKRFFTPEYRKINRKLVWGTFGVFIFFWLLGLIWFYQNSLNILGTNMIKPPRAATFAVSKTAAAPKSRGVVVSENFS
jgi:undecaprenyl-diphosphatase